MLKQISYKNIRLLKISNLVTYEFRINIHFTCSYIDSYMTYMIGLNDFHKRINREKKV
jgi:hypothetical protein